MKIRLGRRNPKVERLSQTELFAGCNRRELSQIAALTNEIDVPEGKVLMNEGDPGFEAFVVVEGRARAERRDGESAVLGPGMCFGEMALMDEGGLRSATVTAETDMRLLVLSGREFSSVLEGVPGVARKVRATFAARLGDAESAY
jgi:CRP-like cAMP-binding protein